jgi:hypothetical protein
MFTFGAGFLVGTQTIDGNGNAVTVPTPIQFGILQEVTPDESFELKKLYGANKFPVAVAQGKGTMGLKAKLANINAELHNTVFYGLSLASSYEAVYQDLIGTVVPTVPGQITPTIHGTALVDLGVVGAQNGVPYTRVSTAPSTGQYGFSSGSGLYFFDDIHDYGKTVYISYAYGDATVTSGRALTITNQPMGVQPVFAVDLATRYLGKTIYVHYPQVIATKLSRTWKNDDFTIYDMDMEAFADANGTVATAYYYE